MRKGYLFLFILIVVLNINVRAGSYEDLISKLLTCVDCVDNTTSHSIPTNESINSSSCVPSCNFDYTQCINGKMTVKSTCTCGVVDEMIVDCNVKESYACYKLDLGSNIYKYVWSKGSPGKDYYKVNNIDSEENCIDKTTNLCTVSKSSESISENYICEDNISTEKVKNGQSCTVDGTSFYEYSCTENFVADYNPQLKNNVMSLTTSKTGISLGFEYNITLSSIKSCTGNFYDGKYNESYRKLKASLDNATNENDKAYYKNLLNDLKNYVKEYNNFYDNLTIGFDTTDVNKTNINAEIILKYRKKSQDDKDKLSQISYPFDVQMISKNVEKNKRTDNCETVNLISRISSIVNYNTCYNTCVKNNKNTIDSCTKNCKSNSICIKNCTESAKLSCKTECKNNSLKEDNNDKCTSKEDLEITLADGNKVSSYGVNIIETYRLTAPQTYLDISGNVVKKIYSGEADNYKGKYTDGGHKFYVDYIKEGNDYKISTVISNLGTNRLSTIKNNDCKLSVDKNEAEKYRIIDVNNPFVNNERLGLLNNNWKNNTFDFTNITNKNTEPLYTFNLSKSDISEIKNDNLKNNSYLGLCKNNNTDNDAIGKICREIYSK